MAQSSQAQAVYTSLNQAQGLFGDPTSSNAFFSNLDNVYSAFSTALASPSSVLSRQSAITSVATFLNSAQSVASNLSQLQSQASQQIGADVTTVNTLLQQISNLNVSITQANLSSGDATGAQDQQNQLINQLSSLMGVNVQTTATGGVTIRSADGC